MYDFAQERFTTMHLKDYVNLETLRQHIASGLVEEHFHNDFPLVLYCYTREAVYSNQWDEVTTRCRGLIVNRDTQEIVARPFEKWHNLGTSFAKETWPENLPPGEPFITEKLDGSVGNLYMWQGRPYIASKGSFHSDHAQWATKHLNARISQGKADLRAFREGFTPIFEMICQDVQHHVVHYDENGLHLLAVVDNNTGGELPYPLLGQLAREMGVPVVKHIPLSLAEARLKDIKNTEGYVATWSSVAHVPFRVKIKFPNFLRLQKLLNSTGPKEILDYVRLPHLQCYLREAIDPVRSTPEFAAYVQQWVLRFKSQYAMHEQAALDAYKCISRIVRAAKDTSRKAFALEAIKPENERYKAILFAMLDNEYKTPEGIDRVPELIWKLIEPIAKGNRPFYTEE